MNTTNRTIIIISTTDHLVHQREKLSDMTEDQTKADLMMAETREGDGLMTGEISIEMIGVMEGEMMTGLIGLFHYW